jgi:FdhD protein
MLMTATSRSRPGTQWRGEMDLQSICRETAQEAAVGLSFNGRPHTVLMTTPADLSDLAVGFTISEAIATFDQIKTISETETPEGFLVDVVLLPGARSRPARPRTLEGRSSCGLCGVQRLADAVRPLPEVRSDQAFSSQAIQNALTALETRQALGRLTRATHAAAFADADGNLLSVREDVGRHNALDKVIGATLTSGQRSSQGFVVVTSRCSFEMVEKTARLGCPMIVAVSAPTDLAIARAEAAGVTLVALARSDGHTVFSHPQRLGLPAFSA